MPVTAVYKPLFFAVLLCLIAGPGLAEDSPWELRGFGTLGVAYNFSDDAVFIRDLSQRRGARGGASLRPDSMLGLQVHYRASDRFDVMVQAVSRYNYHDDFRPLLTWAFLRYSPNPEWTLRLGRMNVDTFMLSDTRQVGYAHTWLRPPIEYFGLQGLNYHMDGADIEYRWQLGPGLAWTRLYLGRVDEKYLTTTGDKLDFEGSIIGGGHLNYQIGNWWFRLGVSTTRFADEFERLEPLLQALESVGSPLATDLSFEETRVTQYSAGAIYERGAFRTQLMAARGTSTTLIPAKHTHGYLKTSYRLGDWRPYAYFSAVSSSRPRRASGFPPGSEADQAVQQFLAEMQNKQRTVALGARYDFHPRAALKLQVEQLRADSGPAAVLLATEPDWNGRATVASATVDFVF